MAGFYVNPSTTSTEVESLISDSQALVTARFEEAMGYADGVMQDAAGFLSSLQSAASGIFIPASINPSFPAAISYKFNIGEAPVAPEAEIYLPAFPVYPTLNAIALVTAIQARLEENLANGATGVNANVENEIWNREAERAVIALDEAKEKAASEWGQRGWTLPDGVLVSSINQIELEYTHKRLDLSRDIAIKQYESAFQNTQFIIQQILAMENLLITAVAKGNELLIDSYKAEIDVFKSKIQLAIEKLGFQVKVFEASGQVYRAKADAQAAIATVDVKAAEAEINMTVARAQISLKQIEMAMKNFEAMAQLRVAAADAGGRIAAAMASGIFSGVSIQAHISGGATVGKSYQGSEQLSETHQLSE